jgi:acetyl/propionyl-CoA carboxylase alpha subunit
MRAVWKEEDLLKGMELVKNLLLLGMMDVSWKLIEEPRHIEIQVIGDSYGKHVTFWKRLFCTKSSKLMKKLLHHLWLTNCV